MSIVFIWGAGGAGKSHYALRRVCHSENPSLLITLDPSRRVFELLNLPHDLKEGSARLGEHVFDVKATDESRLFDQLANRSSPNANVKNFYDQMAKGLQDFRNYLSLLQLSDELSRAFYKTIIVDTPPFQEAIGLHRAIFNLRNLFEKSLVQFALKSAGVGWVHTAIKKSFEVTRVFVGKRASERVFDFMDWLTHNTERFQNAAVYLEKLVFSENTRHFFVLTPETRPKFLDEIRSYFGEVHGSLEFLVNRSVWNFQELSGKDFFSNEIRLLRDREERVHSAIRKNFPRSKIISIPMMLMGDDSQEELLKFVELPEENAV